MSSVSAAPSSGASVGRDASVSGGDSGEPDCKRARFPTAAVGSTSTHAQVRVLSCPKTEHSEALSIEKRMLDRCHGGPLMVGRARFQLCA